MKKSFLFFCALLCSAWPGKAQNACDSLPRIEQNDTTVCLGTQVTLNVRNYFGDSIMAGFTYIGSYGGNQYYASTGMAYWEDAKIICEAAGGHLVTINSSGENAFVSAYNPTTIFWIGLYQNLSSPSYSEPAGGWEWVTGEPLTFTGWAGGEPNQNNGEPEDYVYTNFNGSAQWNDAPSANPAYYVVLRFILEVEDQFSVLWSTGDTTDTISVNPSVTTTYYVTTGDTVKSCYDSVTVYVNDPDPGLADTIATCMDAVSLTAAPGYSSYLWSTFETASSISVSSGGTYTVAVMDSLGCFGAGSALVSLVAARIDQQDTGICAGAAVTLAADSVSGNTFLWSTLETSATIIVAPASSTLYSVQVTDGIGVCSDSVVISVSDPQVSVSSQDMSCFDSGDGSVLASVTGGFGPYAYGWSTMDSAAGVTGLYAGSYFITVTDSLGCTASDTATVSQPDSIAIGAVAAPVLCYGDANGSIDLSVSGGTAPYTYSWDAGFQTQDITGLAGGTYSVMVTDMNACQDSASVVVGEPAVLTLSAVVTDAPCGGAAGNNGAIDLSVSGGTSPYAYLWQNGPATEDLTGLNGGVYTVLVTDTNGCQAALTQTVNQPNPLLLSSVTVDNLCYGYLDGRVELAVAGGSAPYVYMWSNGATTQNILALPGGVYTVTVTDSNLCTSGLTDTIIEPAPVATGLITGNAAPVELTAEWYSVTASPGSTYNWTATNGAVLSGNGTNQISVQWGNAGSAAQVAVSEIDSNGCSGDTVYLNVALQAAEGLAGAGRTGKMMIYPNPVRHTVTVQLGERACDGTLRILSADGKEVYGDQCFRAVSMTADMSRCADGLYFLEFTDERGDRVGRKFVVQK